MQIERIPTVEDDQLEEIVDCVRESIYIKALWLAKIRGLDRLDQQCVVDAAAKVLHVMDNKTHRTVMRDIESRTRF